MPSYTGHIAVGVVAYLLVAGIGYYLHIPWDRLLLSFPMLMIFSLLPDVDSPSSKVRWYVDVTLLILLLALVHYQRTLEAGMVIFALIFLHFTKHRGIFHGPVTGLVLSAPLIMFDPVVGVNAFIGYSSHLIADGMIK